MVWAALIERKSGVITSSSTLQGSFLRAVGLRTSKLGDLLIASHLINRRQLDRALEMQAAEGGQLGGILVREGYVSAVQLYRKLAEQWCVRASAAGVALMMQMTMPGLAQADETSPQIRLASAFAPAAVRPQERGVLVAYPKLFGSGETKSTDISPFVKWTSTIRRFEDEMEKEGHSPAVEAWKDRLAALKDKSVRGQIDGVNDYINAVKYVEDVKNYGKTDYWATPVEFFANGGDCEDYAIAKYASLRALGFSSDQLRIAIVQDKIKNIPHAVLIVYSDEGAFILDNQDKKAKAIEAVDRYRPIFSINSSGWWLHRPAAGV